MPGQILLDPLVNFLEESLPALFPQVELVYLFGSQAEGTACDSNDVDLGILLQRSATRSSDTEILRARLTLEFVMILGRISANSRPDIVWLDRAPIELKFEIIRQGVVIDGRNETERIEFEADTMSRFADFVPV